MNTNNHQQIWTTDEQRKLIAAAPELLELVLQAFDRFTDNDMQPPNHELTQWLNRAREALAKAQG